MRILLTALPVVFLLSSLAWVTVLTGKLTKFAAITGIICGTIIYFGAGLVGLVLLATFFLCGTLATAWGRKIKVKLYRTDDSTQRDYRQVLANAGSATVFSLLAIILPEYRETLLLMTAGSFASATSDTLSSELGMLYGKRFYNCLSWKKDRRGLDGVISLEGTLIGVAGAGVIAMIYAIGNVGGDAVFILIISGLAGNLADSMLGASLERRNLLNNNWVNFLSTLFAAGITLLLISVF